MSSKAYTRGFYAYQCGDARYDNPYDYELDHQLWSDWDDGFREAAEADEEVEA